MNWNLRYAREMDEETLNRLIPTTSSPMVSDGDKFSFQYHRLDRPVGRLQSIATTPDSIGLQGPLRIMMGGQTLLTSLDQPDHEWEFHANKALEKHFEKEPIVLPNKVDPHHPDNHRHILHRVKKFVAYQM